MNKKRLRFIVTLGVGKFGSSDNNRITLEGYRSTAFIDKAGDQTMGAARVQIYGVTQADMNSITTLQWGINQWIKNTVEIYAIDGDSETRVFQGNIINAWAEYHAMPDVFLQITAQSAFFDKLAPAPARSFRGAVDVATVMQQVAASMGRTFENNGVSVMMNDVYLCSTDLEQALGLANDAGIGFFLDDDVLAITPAPDIPRGGIAPVVSSVTGMVGYPTFTGYGVHVTTLFNPSIRFGGTIKIESDVPAANGEWMVVSVAHRLEAEKPNGAWFSTVQANSSGYALAK